MPHDGVDGFAGWACSGLDAFAAGFGFVALRIKFVFNLLGTVCD
jgi:hypothetical protein